MSFVNEHEDVFAPVRVGTDIVELVDHGNDQAAPVGREQCLQMVLGPCNYDVAEPDRFQVVIQLAFQLVPVHKQQHRGITERGVLDQPLGGRDHRVRLAATLRVPDQPPVFRGLLRAYYAALHGAHLVRSQHGLAKFPIGSGEENVVREGPKHTCRLDERLHQRLVVAGLLIAPVEQALAGQAPRRAVIELDQVRNAVKLQDG